MSNNTIDELVHAVANISHVEKPCLENLLTIKKLEIAKEPVDKEYIDATKKVIMWENTATNLENWTIQWLLLKLTCGLQAEKDQAQIGIKKANDLVAEMTEKVQIEKDKIHEVEVQNEKYAVEYRELLKYREDLTSALDQALKSDFAGEASLKQNIELCKEESLDLFGKIETLVKVRELIKEADMSLLEAILELRNSSAKESSVGSGKIYFPEVAFQCLQEARTIYPDLPGFKSPTEYIKEKDNTGAYYSPMQRYLWDVRKRLGELIAWCAEESIVLLEKETETQIQLGQRIDEYNFERRRILKELN